MLAPVTRVLPLPLLPLLLGGCVAWNDAPDAVAGWRPTPVTDAPVRLGVTCLGGSLGFAEPDEVRARVLEQARGLFPRLVRQPAAEARLVELREWAGEHHYAVRIEVVHESSGGPTLSFPLVLLLPPLVLPVVASNEVRATAVVYDPAGDSEWEVESVVTAGAVLWLPMLIPIDPGAFWEPLDLAVADCLRQLGRLYLW